ncbi:MAG: hypothetical protein D6798_10310, partial [Deltaproteobacteria bacterium]
MAVAAGTYEECISFDGKDITVVGTDGSGSTVIDAGGRCETAVTLSEGETATLQGFTITNESDRAIRSVGATLEIDDIAVIDSGTVTADGTALLVEGGVVTVRDSSFDNNYADRGTVHVTAGGELIVDGCSFTSNGAYYGGAIYFAYDSSTGASAGTITNSVFSGNTSYYDGSALYLDQYATVTSQGNTYDSQSGTYNMGAGAYLYSYASLRSTDDTWSNNVAGRSDSYPGGALYLYLGAELTVDGSSFDANSASSGGAFYGVYDNVVDIRNSSFTDNGATEGGGAIRMYMYADLTIADTDFSGNSTSLGSGGDLYIHSLDHLEITGSTFTDSTADTHGGSMYLGATSTTATISSSTFTNSSATSGDGGAIHVSTHSDLSLDGVDFHNTSAYGDGGAIHASLYVDLSLDDVVIDGATSVTGSGGGIYYDPQDEHVYDLTITDSHITECSAGLDGGAIYAEGADQLTISGSTLSDNSAASDRYGGALFAHGTDSLEIRTTEFCNNSARYGGGAYAIFTSSVDTWENNIFQENVAAHYGGALYLGADYYNDLTNNTFVGNEANYQG